MCIRDRDYTSRNRVDNFWSHRFVIRNTRNVDHFLEEGYSTVIFRKHHTNTFIAQLLVFLCIFSLGFFMEKPIFQLPTSSVLFLVFSLVVSIVGALIYWAGGWGTTAIGLILVPVSYTHLDVYKRQYTSFARNSKNLSRSIR